MRKNIIVCKEEEIIVRKKARENCALKSFTKSYEKIRWRMRYEGYGAQIWEMANARKIENSKGRHHFVGPEFNVSILLAYVDLIGIWYL
jgi:hypothetical protein